MATLKCEKLGEEPIICVESSSCNLMATDHGAKSWSENAIRRRKNGRYSARIRDLIRHKEVWLGTFDTVEEASEAYFSKMSEFDKLVKLNQGNDQTLIAASLGRNKTVKSQETTHYVGVSKTSSWRYRARIGNPFSKKEFHLGTFDTAEEASRAYQSKKFEFHKLVKAKKQRNRQTHSSAGEKKQGGKVEVINVNRGHETILPEGLQPESASGASSWEIEIPISNSFNGGTTKDGSEDCFSYKSEFEKLSKRNMEDKPKNCDQIQPESPCGASSSVGNDQTLIAASLGRNKTIKSQETTHYVGVSKTPSWRYRARIGNPFSKKEFHLGTFDTAEEASQAYQSKKVEFQKLVEAKQHCNRQTPSSAGEKKQDGKVELVNVKHRHETVNLEHFQPESASEASSSEIEVPISNSFNEGTGHRIDSDQMSHIKWVKKRETGKCNLFGDLGTDEEAFRADQWKKFNFQRPKKVVLQSNLPTHSSVVESPEDEDSCTGKWVQLPGDKAVKISLKLGLPIVDNYGSLLGEFSSLDDLSIC